MCEVLRTVPDSQYSLCVLALVLRLLNCLNIHLTRIVLNQEDFYLSQSCNFQIKVLFACLFSTKENLVEA